MNGKPYDTQQRNGARKRGDVSKGGDGEGGDTGGRELTVSFSTIA